MNTLSNKSCIPVVMLMASCLLRPEFAFAWPEEGRASISPTLVELEPGETQQFVATMLPRRLQPAWPADGVKWSVNGVAGGDAQVGHIDAKGLYRAPDNTPECGELHIAAEVPDATNPVLFATILIKGANHAYRRVKTWDQTEVEKSGLKDPRGIALDSKGSLLIADMQQANILHFSNDGAYLGPFGLGPDGKTIAHEGMCVVAVHPDGRVFAADRKTGPPRVEAFDADGNWLFGFAPKGAQRWMVAEPSGLAFHPNGDIFLADMDAMRVAVYDGKGKLRGLLREHAPDGNRFNAPSGAAFDPAGDLFVSSLYGPCEKLIADTGERVFAFAYPEPPGGLMFIDDLCIDRWGNVFLAVRCAADPVESGPEGGGVATVLKFNNHGDFLTRIELSANAPARASVAIDSQDRVYVAYSEGEDEDKTAGIEIFEQKSAAAKQAGGGS